MNPNKRKKIFRRQLLEKNVNPVEEQVVPEEVQLAPEQVPELLPQEEFPVEEEVVKTTRKKKAI